MDTHALPAPHQRALVDGRVGRFIPLAGAAYAVVTFVGDLVINAFPDENTSTDQLTQYYAAHHSQVAAGGLLVEIAAVFLALFGAAIALRVWPANPLAAWVIGIGSAALCLSGAYTGATFKFLGLKASESQMSPDALQAWHLSASGFGTAVPILVFALGLTLAVRALPAWVVWTGLALALLQLSPFGFLASMVMLVWFLVAGIVLTARPGL